MGPTGQEHGGRWHVEAQAGGGRREGAGLVRGVKHRKEGAGHVCPCGQELDP